MRGSSSGVKMKYSLIDRLNLLIRRFTLLSVLFAVVVFAAFFCATYYNEMNSLSRESSLWASRLKDFTLFLEKKSEREMTGPAYAWFEDGLLYVNRDHTWVISRDDFPENVFIFSPDGDTFEGKFQVSEGPATIGGYRGFVSRFPVGKSFWYVFTGTTFFSIFLSQAPFLLFLVLVSFLYARVSRFFLVKMKGSLKKDLDVLTSLVESFAENTEKWEIPALAGTESWEIRSLSKILFDVSIKLREIHSEALQKAGTDELTGLANKRAFEEKIENRILQNRMFSLIFMDLNGFKPINDKLGHDKGDEVLKEVADKLRRVFRDYDFISRWGGDEFAVLFEGDAEKLYDSVKGRVINALSEIDAEGMKVSAAIGYAVWPMDGKTQGELLKKADERMYADKIISKSA